MKLTSLERLELSFCESLELFPEILGQMNNIERIILKGTSIEEFPLSFQNLTGLHTLRIWGSGMLRLSGSILLMPSLSDIYAQGCQLLPIQNDELNSTVFSNVQELWLIKCNLPDELLSALLIWFANVQKLRLIKCNLLRSNFTIIPACLKECRLLGSLILNCCKYLPEIKGFPPMLRCKNESLSSSSRSMLLNQVFFPSDFIVYSVIYLAVLYNYLCRNRNCTCLEVASFPWQELQGFQSTGLSTKAWDLQLLSGFVTESLP
jgi:hypothetical protein